MTFHFNSWGIGWLVWITLCTALLHADDAKENQVPTEGKADEQRRLAYVRTMRSVAEGFKIVRVADGDSSECKLVEESVLNWSDSARHPDLVVPGTTWIWHHNGRPEFVVEIYGRVNDIGNWIIFGCTLTSDPLQVSAGALQRSVTKTYYEPKEIANAPVVAKTKAERTFQMRQIAARFDAHQFWEDRFELRLLPKPIYRYEDVGSGIIDGALYALVHGTNPEVLLLVEAHTSKDGSARWKVGFGSLAGAQCFVRLDGNEYWTCPRHLGDPNDPRQGFNKFVRVAEVENAR